MSHVIAPLFVGRKKAILALAAYEQGVGGVDLQVRGRVQFTNSDRLFDASAMASCGLPPLLALEIPEPGRPATDRCGSTGADPTNEH